MVEAADRFEFFPDPAGGWTVWDDHADEPAMFSHIVLTNLSRQEAQTLCNLLNSFNRPTHELSRLSK